MMIVYVHQANIVGNSLSGNNTNGIDVLHSSNIQMSRNSFNRTAVTISNTHNVTLTSNLSTGVSAFSMLTISGGSNISVWNNTFEGDQGGTALSLANVTNASLAGNWISDNGYGVAVDGANGLNMTANNLVRNGWGLRLGPGSPNGIFNGVIYHNNFVDSSGYQAVFFPPVVTAFDNGYPSGGNFWSDYRGVDKCSGLQQNMCSGPDGIGDTRYTGIWEQFYRGGALGNLLDRYPLVNPYGNFSWDTAAPSWPSGSKLTVSVVNSTSLTIKWTGPIDDAWISGYRVYQDGTLLANLPRYTQNYTISHLSPGSMHVFKVEAGDPARNWSTDGPSATATLPQQTNSIFTASWWMDHWYVGILIGGLAGLAMVGVFLFRKRKMKIVPDKKLV
jgi:hypothetical protein